MVSMPEGAKPKPPAYPIESVDNALQLLLLFREQPTLRVADAGRTLGVAPSTAHRLIAMLQYHGFVEQDPRSKAYRAGAALAQIGLAVVRAMDVRTVARPYMEQLGSDLGETIHLATLERREVIFLDSVESRFIVRVGSRVGMRLPAHMTALGKVLLASLPGDRLAELYPEEQLPGSARTSLVNRKVLFKSLKKIANDGHAVSVGEVESDVAAIAAPIRAPSGQVTAAMSVAVPVSRFSEQFVARAVPRLAAAVAQISGQL
jgi:DNA-binding IclR family transcriptional regulator